MKKTVLAVLAVFVIILGMYIGYKREFDQFNPFYEKEEVYAFINTPGKSEKSRDIIRYRYNLMGYTEQGDRKKITFSSGSELEQRIYVKVVAKGAYTEKWTVINKEDIPNGALDKLSERTDDPSENSVKENLQGTLEQYIQAIADQDSAKMVELYGGDYQWLINLFPETDPGDKQKLFEQYLQITSVISLKGIIEQTEVSEDESKFVVTLKNEDGSLYHTREFDKITDKFTYTVKRVEGKLKIMELPPYQA